MRQIDLHDAYRVLGLSESASLEEVKNAYKKLALQFHPDKNTSPDATERFQEIGTAYGRVVKHLENPDDEDNAFWFDDEDDEGPNLDFFLFLFSRMFAGGSRFGGGPPHMRRETFAENSEHRRREGMSERNYSYEEERQRLRAQLDAQRRVEEAEREHYFAERRKRALRDKLEAQKRENERLQQQQRQEAARAAEREEQKKKKKEGKAKARREQSDTLLETKRASQRKRSEVFQAARNRNAERVKIGVWEQNVDAAGPECLAGMGQEVTFLEGHQPLHRDSRETLLHIFSKHGDLNMVKWLLDHNAEAEERDSWNRTPFHLALQNAHLSVISFFIETFTPQSEDSEAIFEPPKIDSDPSREYSLLRLSMDSASPAAVRMVLDNNLFDQNDLEAAWEFITGDGSDGPGQIYGATSSAEYADDSKNEKLSKAWVLIRDLLRREGNFEVSTKSPPPTLPTPGTSPVRGVGQLPHPLQHGNPLELPFQKKKKPKKPKKKATKVEAGQDTTQLQAFFTQPTMAQTETTMRIPECPARAMPAHSTVRPNQRLDTKDSLGDGHNVEDIKESNVHEPELSYPSPISGYPSSPEATINGEQFHHYSDNPASSYSSRRSQHQTRNAFLPSFRGDDESGSYPQPPAAAPSEHRSFRGKENPWKVRDHVLQPTTRTALPFAPPFGSPRVSIPVTTDSPNDTGDTRAGDNGGAHYGSGGPRQVFERKGRGGRYNAEADDANDTSAEGSRGSRSGRGQRQGQGRGRGNATYGQADGPEGCTGGGESAHGRGRGWRGRGRGGRARGGVGLGRGRGATAGAYQAGRRAVDTAVVI